MVGPLDKGKCRSKLYQRIYSHLMKRNVTISQKNYLKVKFIIEA